MGDGPSTVAATLDLAQRVGVEPASLRVAVAPAVDAASDLDGDLVSRATVAMTLAVLLFDDLRRAVPSARAYHDAVLADGRRLPTLDHGAVRTVDVACGALPAGQKQVTRLLVPLGYAHRETYDLEPLRMTGRSWTHLDHPELVPQWFVSELHLDRFDPEVATPAAELFGRSTDALQPHHHALLHRLGDRGVLTLDEATELLPALRRAFERRHPEPTDRDHDLFLRHSPELAWIATEGTTANHWTDRVDDLEAVAAAERLAGRPIKESIEVSATGRVRQTAHHAVRVTRRFHTVEGDVVHRDVPGSFFEMIERHPHPDGGIDLAFDAANATGIFAMTRDPNPADDVDPGRGEP